ncbi:MAG: Ig-like domain-containing protein, partial [Gemmatimonadota bacterium]|nr:Ig-like domain-containing protein [Gemmatimonadota bacterium]
MTGQPKVGLRCSRPAICTTASFVAVVALAACGDDPMGVPPEQSGGVSIVTAVLDRPATDWITVSVSAIPAPPAVTSDFELSENRTLTFRPGEMSSSGVVAIAGKVHGEHEPDRYVTVIALPETRSTAITPSQPVTLALADIPDVCRGSSALDFERGSFYRDDCNALLAARDELRGTAMLKWDTALAMPEWEGVTLGTLGVEKVALPFFELDGTIPPELGELAHAKVLNLNGNALTNAIPPELGSMARLEHLLLWGNDLEGEIPPELGGLARLEVLIVSSNELTGELPAELGNLGRLRKFEVHSNDLTGEIPPELGKMRSVQYMLLSGNQFTGTIPPELGDMRALRRLSLSRNKLTGTIPPELGRLANLNYLSLVGNQLTGSIPPELAGATELIWLYLGANQLTGNIPSELGSLDHLAALNLGTNRLEGSIPPELGSNSRLFQLYIDTNPGLTGPIPMSFVETWLSRFYWHDTALCSPNVPSFQAWLKIIGDHRGGDVCGDGDFEAFNGLVIGDDGSISLQAAGITLSVGQTGCLHGSTLNGKLWDYHWSAWQRDTGSGWNDVSGTRTEGRLCGYDLTSAPDGKYRMIGDWTLAGVRGKYKSGNEVTVGGGGGNQSPVTLGSIPSATMNAGESVSVNASSYFSDPDGDALTYTANSSRTSVATTSVSGGTVTVAGVAAGTTTIRITATDPGGLSAAQTFSVTVEAGGGGDDYKVLSGLTITASGAIKWGNLTNTGCIGATRITISGSTYDVHWTEWQRRTGGSAWSQVSGTRKTRQICGYNLSNAAAGTYRFVGEFTPAGGTRGKYKSENEVTVGGGGGNQSPVAVSSIPSATVKAGESVSVNASSYFNDPDGDALTYTASSSGTSVATTSVSGRTVTVAGVAAGTTTIRITATDPGGLSAEQTFTVTVAGGGGGSSDREVLVALYNATDGPNWKFDNHWLTAAPLGDWAGVDTDASGRVVRLDLSYNDLTGKIPPELGNLERLEELGLTSNQLTGEFRGHLA